jgi:hypothetical protein
MMLVSRAQKAIQNTFISSGRPILRTFLLTMVAEDPEVLKHVRLTHVILRVERYLFELPFFYFLAVKLSFFLIEYAIPPLGMKLRPFTWLSLQQRERYLDEWQNSNFYPKRILFKAAASVCLGHLYSEKKLLESIGFKGSMDKRVAHQW